MTQVCHKAALPKVLLIVALLASIATTWLTFSADSPGCTIVQTLQDTEKTALAELDKMLDLGIKLSTALTGLGAGLLLGISKGPRLELPSRLLLLTASYLFAFSTYFGYATKHALVQRLVNACNLDIAGDAIQYRYLGEYYFFVAGMAVLAMLILTSTFQRGESGGADALT